MYQGVTMLEKESNHVDEIKIHLSSKVMQNWVYQLVKRCWEDDHKKIQTS